MSNIEKVIEIWQSRGDCSLDDYTREIGIEGEELRQCLKDAALTQISLALEKWKVR